MRILVDMNLSPDWIAVLENDCIAAAMLDVGHPAAFDGGECPLPANRCPRRSTTHWRARSRFPLPAADIGAVSRHQRATRVRPALTKRAATAQQKQQEMCSIHGHLVTRLLVGLHRLHCSIEAVALEAC